jgi:peptidoglycan/LPS O-acetylase OafA/YrhL
MGVQIRPRNGFLFRLASLGGISVSFFYLLSGFILAWVYLRQGKQVDKRRFYTARFARIYPIFFLMLVADSPWYFLSQVAHRGIFGALSDVGASFTGSLLMLGAWNYHLLGINVPGWSLSVETLFYAVFPFAGFFLWRLRRKWTWVAMFFVYFAGQGLVLLAIQVAPSHNIMVEMALYFPPLHVSTFLLGILLARLKVYSCQTTGGLSSNASSAYVALAIPIVAYTAVVQFTSTSFVTSLRGNVILRDGILAPIFCVAIWAVSTGNALPSRLLSAKWLVVLGESSYGLYLIHIPVLHALNPIFLRLSSVKAHAEFAVLYVLSSLLYLSLCIFLSIASFYWIEGPARKWILRKLRTRAQETLEASSAVQ